VTSSLVTRAGELALREDELIQVLGSSLYPGAHPDSIRMVLGYCRAAGLDPLQKPVHIVPLWNGKTRQMVDVVMPGIGLYRTQAARNGCAGVSEPEFGPDVTEEIGGAKTTYPAWCKVTVKRRISTGEIVEFTAKEFWRENYAVKGGQDKSIAPNAMWSKRPYGQIAKCAEAQALRKAFPEIGSEPTADEMEGKVLHADEPIRHTPLPSVAEVMDVLEAGRAEIIREAADKAVSQFEAGNEIAAYEEVSGITEVDEKLYLWNYLKPHSKLRASLKRMAAADAVAPKEAA
jgi:phage recombination protein Bet